MFDKDMRNVIGKLLNYFSYAWGKAYVYMYMNLYIKLFLSSHFMAFYN